MQRSGFNNARVRQANKQIFLSHLWREKQLSKSQLSQLTGLSIPAVSNILAELLSEGLIGHSTEHLSKRGVNSGSYQIPEHGAWTLCMNITPTSIEYQLADARLLAVDAKTGQPCADFGVNGQVDLKKGMGDIIPGYYYVSSMPQVVRGKVVVGGWVSDGQMTGEPSGVIRAFDAKTGAFSWAFDMGKPDFHGEPAEGEIGQGIVQFLDGVAEQHAGAEIHDLAPAAEGGEPRRVLGPEGQVRQGGGDDVEQAGPSHGHVAEAEPGQGH